MSQTKSESAADPKTVETDDDLQASEGDVRDKITATQLSGNTFMPETETCIFGFLNGVENNERTNITERGKELYDDPKEIIVGRFPSG